MNPYVFFVGCARSGTTLVERLADAHPMLAVTHGTRWIVELFQDGAGLTQDGRITSRLVDQLAGHRRFKSLLMERSDLEELYRAQPDASYAEFVTGLFDLYGARQGKEYVGDRSPEYVKSVSVLHGLWPSARVVHIIRDGRNVWLSVSGWQKGASHFPTWEEDRVSTTAVWWERNVRLAREAGARLGPELYQEVRYEAIVDDPERESRRLCGFLGLPYDEAMLRFHEGKQLTAPGLDAKKAWLPVTAGLRTWESQMADDEVVRFEAAAGALLDELDYPRRHPSPPTAAREHAERIRAAYVADARHRGLPVPEAWAGVPA
jgi:hypothetical protein